VRAVSRRLFACSPPNNKAITNSAPNKARKSLALDVHDAEAGHSRELEERGAGARSCEGRGIEERMDGWTGRPPRSSRPPPVPPHSGRLLGFKEANAQTRHDRWTLREMLTLHGQALARARAKPLPTLDSLKTTTPRQLIARHALSIYLNLMPLLLHMIGVPANRRLNEANNRVI
jgi:hypothetical protein